MVERVGVTNLLASNRWGNQTFSAVLNNLWAEGMIKTCSVSWHRIGQHAHLLNSRSVQNNRDITPLDLQIGYWSAFSRKTDGLVHVTRYDWPLLEFDCRVLRSVASLLDLSASYTKLTPAYSAISPRPFDVFKCWRHIVFQKMTPTLIPATNGRHSI